MMQSNSGPVGSVLYVMGSQANDVAELEAILVVPTTPTLTQLDNTLRMFITFTGAYHGAQFVS